MNNSLVETANRIRGYVTAAVAGVMVYALYVSMAHITHVATFIGIPGWQARTAFLLVDLPALIGKVLQMKYFAQSTRKTGRKLTYFSGAISLACNVLSGVLHGSAGAAGWGAFVVVMFLVLESVITKIKPAAAVTRAKNAAEGKTEKVPTPKVETGPRGGQKWSAERRAAFEAAKAAKEKAKLEEQFALASVAGISPVSPA
jgi:uncharacterized membrane protein